MAIDAKLRTLLESFVDTGAWPGARVLSHEQAVELSLPAKHLAVLEGPVTIGAHTITLYLGLERSFPHKLPGIWLAEPGCLGLIPHEDNEGFICYHRNEGIVINRHAPLAVIRQALEQAIQVLRDGERGTNSSDLMEEFGAYWLNLPLSYTVRSVVEPASRPKAISVVLKDGKPDWLGDSPTAVTKFYHETLGERSVRRAIYLPLSPDTVLTPPQREQFWTVRDIRHIVDRHVAPKNRPIFHKLMRQQKPRGNDELLVLGVPRPSGGETLIGVEFANARQYYPLLPGGRCTDVRPVQISRRDRTYLLPRGGGNLELSQKHVLLVGAGAVGGYVAMALGSAGLGKLTIVDHDYLNPENIFRHVVGKSWLGSKKVDAVKSYLEARYPFIEVHGVAKRIEEAIEDKDISLTTFDAIVVALGVATVELWFNEQLYGLEAAPPTVFTWLEPMGIGGHVLLTGGWGWGWERIGCLQCLYTQPDSALEPFVTNRAAFAAPGHDYTRDMLGCGGAFVPFAGLDAIRTAELAVRSALDVLGRNEPGHPLISWKGNNRAFLAEGLTLTPRYSQSEKVLWENRYGYQLQNCIVCGEVE